MNTLKQTRLTLALGAGLFAGSMLTANMALAQESDFQAFSRHAVEQVRQEATTQPGTAERLNQIQGSLAGARVAPGLSQIPLQGERAIDSIRAEVKASFRRQAPAAVANVLAQHAPVYAVAQEESLPAVESGWSIRAVEMPTVDIKPMLDLSILLFSFDK